MEIFAPVHVEFIRAASKFESLGPSSADAKT